MEEAREVLRSMLLGLLFFDLTAALICVWTVPDSTCIVNGILFGCAWGVALGLHLFRSIDRALDMDENSAVRYMRSRSILRSFGMLAALVIAALLPRFFSIWGTVIGILGLKVGAYLQPLLQDVIGFLSERGR